MKNIGKKEINNNIVEKGFVNNKNLNSLNPILILIAVIFIINPVFACNLFAIQVKEFNHPLYPLEEGAIWVYRGTDPEIGTVKEIYKIISIESSGDFKKAIISWKPEDAPPKMPPMKRLVQLMGCRIFRQLLPYNGGVKGSIVVSFSKQELILLEVAKLRSGTSWNATVPTEIPI